MPFLIKADLRYRQWHNQGQNCFWCKGWLRWGMTTLDHLIPKSMGGKEFSRNPAVEMPPGAPPKINYVVACRQCNIDRGSMSAIDFYNKMKADGAYNPERLAKVARKNVTKKYKYELECARFGLCCET